MLEIKGVVSIRHDIKDGKICFVVESCSFDQFCKSYSVHLGKKPILWIRLSLSLLEASAEERDPAIIIMPFRKTSTLLLFPIRTS